MTNPLQIPCASAIALWLLFANCGLALDPGKAITQYHLDVWAERDGLPQGSVQAVTQTKDGYLWMGTRDGLARFDGVAFTVFRAETNPGLQANDIRALREDKSGRLWIGTFNGGLSCYSDGKFSSFTTRDGLPSNGVLDIFQDRAGDMWFGTWNGLARLESGKFVSYKTSQGLIGQNALSFCEDPSGQLWVATEDGLNRRVGDRFEAALKPGRLPDSPFREVYADRNGRLWISTIGAGLFEFAPSQRKAPVACGGLPDNKVRTVLQDRHGNLWVGTWSGLCRRQGSALAKLTRQDGLPHDHIECLYEDREGSLWIGTRGGGLARLRDGKFSNFTTKEGLAHNFAKCVFEDRDGAHWIGTHGGGLSRYQNGTFTNFTTEHGLASHYVWAIEQDPTGNIWVGTSRPAALHLFKDGRFTSYRKQHGLAVRGGVRALAADKEGNLWIGGDGGALCKFRDGIFTCYSTTDGLPSTFVRAIRQDRDGDLWIATNEGLCRYRKGQFARYTTEDGLAHNAIYTILQDSKGALWFGTQGGLSCYSEERFRSYFSRDGLFQNVIYEILADEKENLWMSSNRGVFSVARQAFLDFDRGRIRSLACSFYGTADGMKTVQCEGGTQPAGCRDKDGKLWFATANGVTVIDPCHVEADSKPPPVLIEHVWAGKNEVETRKPVRLSPGTREFRFQYTALSFAAPEKVRFKYKLDGLDKTWMDAETRRVAFYNEIPPGDYRFRVIGCNSDGVWNETGAMFAFALAPHFYQTLWFYVLCVVAIAVGAWSFHRQRMARARAQFSLVLAERNRIARDLHDTLAQGFAGIAFQLEAVAVRLTEAPSQARQHLTVALQMVRHSLAEARRSVMNLRSTALENGGLGNAVAETARHMMAGKEVDIQLKIAGTPRPLPLRTENELLHIGQEAITNSFKYSRASRIEIAVAYEAGLVSLCIRDDGQGFDQSEATRDEEKHFGLLGMRERAEQMGARLSIRTEPGKGTEVLVEVPDRLES